MHNLYIAFAICVSVAHQMACEYLSTGVMERWILGECLRLSCSMGRWAALSGAKCCCVPCAVCSGLPAVSQQSEQQPGLSGAVEDGATQWSLRQPGQGRGHQHLQGLRGGLRWHQRV